MQDLWWPSLNSPGFPSVLCVGHAGAWPGVFRPLARCLDGFATVRALRLPGRDKRLAEPLLTDARSASAGALTGFTEPPAVLIGVCTGAYLAWRLAHDLAHAQDTVPAQNPSGPAHGLAGQAGGIARTCTLVTVGAAATGQAQRLKELSALDDEAIRQRLIRSGATAPELLEDEEFSAAIIGGYRADITIAAEPLPAIALPQPIIAVSGALDNLTDAELGSWSDFTAQPGDPFRIPGAGHWVLADQPQRFADWLCGLL